MRDLNLLTDDEAALWVDGFSSAGGHNDRTPESETASVGNSLRLIRVPDFTVETRPNDYGGRRRTRGVFSYAKRQYDLSVTDPPIERRYLNQPDARHELGACFLTISLGELFDGYAYKLVAGVIRPE